MQQELERRILAGNILPGDKLNENEVATELNVSRGPVREALRALEQAGLVKRAGEVAGFTVWERA